MTQDMTASWKFIVKNSVPIRRRGDDFEKSTYELQQNSNVAA